MKQITMPMIDSDELACELDYSTSCGANLSERKAAHAVALTTCQNKQPSPWSHFQRRSKGQTQGLIIKTAFPTSGVRVVHPLVLTGNSQ